ncbi:hypothetical protein SAMD00019534_069220, partial [Acytostelium subglobosum LB1]|uniref:hypothetical protein n=1 Tax=Acytostelium subglobosum LB1 TaxID=1410327 RepID=UPI000644D052
MMMLMQQTRLTISSSSSCFVGGRSPLLRSLINSSSRYYTTTTTGKVYSWGSGSNGKLGHGMGVNQLNKPTFVRELIQHDVTHISCGTTFTMFAAAATPTSTIQSQQQIQLLGCGDNSYGQLIIGNGKIPVLENIVPLSNDCESFKPPNLVGRSVKQLTSGTFHSACLLDDGNVYLWGSANSGQLGSPTYARLLYNPYLNTRLQKTGVQRLSCGSTFTVALSNDGQLYTFGSAIFNELGHDNEFNERTPKRIRHALLQDRPPVVDISSGYFHSMALTQDNRVLVWGRNQEGQCQPVEKGMEKGCFSSVHELDISRLHGDPIIQIGCGSFSSYILTKSGAMYSIGSNDHGQLGVGSESLFGQLNHISTLPAGITKFWTGHQYAIATDGQKYYGWGSNYDFQLALDKRCVYNQPVVLDSLSAIGQPIKHIAASVTHALALV